VEASKVIVSASERPHDPVSINKHLRGHSRPLGMTGEVNAHQTSANVFAIALLRRKIKFSWRLPKERHAAILEETYRRKIYG
jgi:hypothetical protein